MKWTKVLNLNDVCQLVSFDKNVHPPQDLLTVDEYVTWLRRGLEIHCLKDQNDNWLGLYQILQKSEEEIYFAGFGVDHEHHGHGFGQMLMGHMIREYGHKKLTCKTRESNHIMKYLLGKNNFFRDHDEIDDRNDHWTWWTRYPISNLT